MTRAIISVFFLLLILCVPAVSAVQYISFAQPNSFSSQDIYLYNGNGSLLGLYNTTSTAIAIPNGTDLMFVLKPQYTTPLDDPGAWLSSTFSYVSTNIVALIIIIFLIGLLLGRK